MRKIDSINSEGPLPEGSALFTIDVVAMYPSIPKDLGLEAAREALNQRKVQVPSTENLMKCLEAIDSATIPTIRTLPGLLQEHIEDSLQVNH